MRKRAVRDIGTILGIVIILVVIVLVNGYVQRGGLAEEMTKLRKDAEETQVKGGTDLLAWDVMRKTKGTRATGPSFSSQLLENKDKEVSVVGFMVPLYEFRSVSEFLLLPLPLQCYFCEAPPMRDVMLVQMAKDSKTDIANEPVAIRGTLTLNEGPGTKFFYVLKDAGRGSGKKGGKLTKKAASPIHMEEAAANKQAEESSKEELLQGQEPPKSESALPEPK